MFGRSGSVIFASQVTEIFWLVLVSVVVIVLAVLILRNKIDIVKIKAGPLDASVTMNKLHQDLKEIKETVKRVDDSTNHRREGDPTLAGRVEIMEKNQRHEKKILNWQNDTLMQIAHHVGFIPTPAPKEEEEAA